MSTAGEAEASSSSIPPAVTTTSDGGADNDRNAKAFRCQKVFDQALRWIKMAGSSSDRIQPLLKEAYALALEVHGERDLKTARIGWQLASTLLTSGLTDQAVPLLESVQKTREALLPDTSDELYDVYADLSYVHMSKAQQSSNREKQAEEFRQAMDLAQKAKVIVKKNANSSTTDRYYSRQCLISSRLGSIHRAQGQHAESVVEFDQALQSAERLAMDQDKNVKLRVHVILERASAELHRTSMLLAQTKKKSTKLSSNTSTAGATTTTAAAADPASTIPSRSAADLYSQAISILKEHHLEEMPFMAQAQAGLALVLMADADTLHQEMLKDKSNKKSTAAAATSTTAASQSSSTASSASPSPTISPTVSNPSSLSPSPTPPASSSASSASKASEKTALIKQLLNQSVQLTTDAMKLYQTIGGEGSHDVATMCYNLGSLYVRLDEVSSARTYLNRSLDLRKKLYGPSHPSVLQVEVDLKKIKSLPDTTPLSARLQRRSTMPSAPNGNTTTGTVAVPSSAASSPLASGRRRNFVPAASSGSAKPSLNPVPPSMPATTAASGSMTSRPTVNRARTSAPLSSSGSQSARGTAVVAARALKASAASKTNVEPATNTNTSATTSTAPASTMLAATVSSPAPIVSVPSVVISTTTESVPIPTPAAANSSGIESTKAITTPLSPIATDSMVVTINPQSATTTTTTTSVVSLTPTLTVVSTEISTTSAADTTDNAGGEKKKPLSRPSSSKTYIIHRSASKGTLPTAAPAGVGDLGTSSDPPSLAASASVITDSTANGFAAATTTAATVAVPTVTPTLEGNASATPVAVNPARASGKYILRPKSAVRALPSSGPVVAISIANAGHLSSSAPSAGDSASLPSSQSKDGVSDVKSPTEQKHAPVADTLLLPTKPKVDEEERKESDTTQTPASSDVAPPTFNPQFLSF